MKLKVVKYLYGDGDFVSAAEVEALLAEKDREIKRLKGRVKELGGEAEPVVPKFKGWSIPREIFMSFAPDSREGSNG